MAGCFLNEINYTKLSKAYRVIFGNSSIFNIQKLSQLSLDEIKSAYRTKSKKSHPDCSAVTGLDKEILNTEFKKLNNSYNTILAYKKTFIKKENYLFKNNLNTDILPGRKLKFGEFLYYKKKINWQTLMEAIINQKSYKNKFGNICLEFKFLNKNNINNIIKNKQKKEKFGQSALRLGLITVRQLKLVLDVQKKRKIPIGKYFVDNNILNKIELRKMLNLNQLHNSKIN